MRCCSRCSWKGSICCQGTEAPPGMIMPFSQTAVPLSASPLDIAYATPFTRSCSRPVWLSDTCSQQRATEDCQACRSTRRQFDMRPILYEDSECESQPTISPATITEPHIPFSCTLSWQSDESELSHCNLKNRMPGSYRLASSALSDVVMSSI